MLFDYYLKSKIFLLYRYNIRIVKRSEEKGRQNTEKVKNIKYKVENLMQENIKYLYQRRLNEKLN